MVRPGFLSFEPPTGKVEIAEHFESIEGIFHVEMWRK
nr:hypothetical protein [Anoxybacillus caldiproteolyticus]